MNKASFGGFLGVDISKDKFDAYCIGGECHDIVNQKMCQHIVNKVL
jgi:hypothetical protein